MKIATWNVNSIRARQDLVLDWLKRVEPDVLCLQETKVVDDMFPTDGFQRLGYGVAMAGQKTYNGVAIASRLPLTDIQVGLAGEAAGADRRLIAATAAGVRLYSAYVPNGKAVASPAFAAKLRWLAGLRATLCERSQPDQDVLLCGDFNIAADARDVYDPAVFAGQLHFHPDEHSALGQVLGFGLIDAYRLHHADSDRFSWWDYRASSFRKNQGLRLDYVFLSRSLAARCTAAHMDVEERRRDKPSDHIPVVVELS